MPLFVINATGQVTGQCYPINVEADHADDVYDMIIDLGLKVEEGGYGMVPESVDFEVMP